MSREHLLKEAHHRGSNDLQMVVSLLTLMARAAMTNAKGRDLYSALRDVCTALQTLAEPRGIVVALHLEVEPDGLDESAITAISMAVNELATNAIKHAFADRQRGTVLVSVQDAADGTVSIFVTDDGAVRRRSDGPYGADGRFRSWLGPPPAGVSRPPGRARWPGEAVRDRAGPAGNAAAELRASTLLQPLP